jgi:hypothetical protein
MSIVSGWHRDSGRIGKEPVSLAIVPFFPIRAKTEKDEKPPRKSIGCNAGLQRVGDSQREI